MLSTLARQFSGAARTACSSWQASASSKAMKFAPVAAVAGAAPFVLTRSVASATCEGLTGPTKAVPGREAALYTPGPLTTSLQTKQAMLVDLGSRDSAFTQVIVDVRNGLLELAGTSQEGGHECVIMQGSGTFGVEAVMSSIIPRDGKALILNNGAYGVRMAKIAAVHGIEYTEIVYSEREAARAEDVAKALAADPSITHVLAIHHETTSGVLNPIAEIGAAIKAANPDITYVVDSMSAFGAYDVDMANWNVHFMVSSSNKCIEGVPGFSYILADRARLIASEGNARSLSLDIYDQWKVLEASGQFRFTPPTHALLAFKQAMDEHAAEGGIAGRYARYKRNFDVLVKGMAEMGFELYLEEDVQGVIISTFLHADDPNFDFPRLYTNLAARGLVIYPGKLTKADCFRIGSIGRLFERDMQGLLAAFKEELLDMGVTLPVKQIKAD